MKAVFVAVVAALCVAGDALADEAPAKRKPLKVLMIGNSFTASVLKETPSLAKAEGLPLDITQCGIGGCTFEKHWKNVEKADDKDFKPYFTRSFWASDPQYKSPHKANVTDMLSAEKWDVVTIQQASGKSVSYADYQPHADNLIAKIRELAPQAEIVIQQTWSYAPYDGRLANWKMSPKEMTAAVKSAYSELAKKHGLRMIPTGDAVQLFRERLPVDYGKVLTRAELAAIPRPSTVDFHGDVTGSSAWKKGTKGSQKDWEEVKLRIDSSHLNPRGQYLQACVWLGFLFKTDPTAFSHRPKDLSESDAKLMRQCARDALR